MEGATLNRVVDEIETLGFSVVEGVVTTAQARELRAELLVAIERDARLFGNMPGKKPELVQNLAIHGGGFLDLMDNDVMHEVFKHFLGEHCILYNFSSTALFPNADSAVQEIHVDSPRIIENYHDGLIMTLALDDFTPENGATEYLPGSFRFADRPDVAAFDRAAVSVARPHGAAVFFNPRAFHRGGHNRTDTVRCGVTVFAVRPFMKQRFDFPRMVTPEELADKPPRVRRFLGFDARVPATMQEFYAVPDERLYKPGQE